MPKLVSLLRRVQSSVADRGRSSNRATSDDRQQFERQAVMDERAIFVEAIRRGMGETTYPEVRATFEARIASGEFRVVAGDKYGTSRQFTTVETIRAEQEIIKTMQGARCKIPCAPSESAWAPAWMPLPAHLSMHRGFQNK